MKRFAALDSWRGLAACLVAFHHLGLALNSHLNELRLIANGYLFVTVEYDDGTGLTTVVGVILALLVIGAIAWGIFGGGFNSLTATGGGQGETATKSPPRISTCA